MEHRKRIILDTHIWIKWLLNEGLAKRHIQLLENPAIEKCLSSFSIWEVAMLVAKKRLHLNQDTLTWVSLALERSQVVLIPLSPKIAVLSCNLPKNFHGDPGDRIIVASAFAENIPLITNDKQILNYIKINKSFQFQKGFTAKKVRALNRKVT